jgi:hypothetical protein
LQRLANPANPYPKKSPSLVGKSVLTGEEDRLKAEADYEAWKKPKTEAETPPVELLKRLADPEKPHAKEANGAKSETKEEPKAKTLEQAIGEKVRAELKAKGTKTAKEAKPPMTGVRSGFSLRTFTFKEARTSFEKSLAALRTFGVSFSYDKFRNQLLVGGHALAVGRRVNRTPHPFAARRRQ